MPRRPPGCWPRVCDHLVLHPNVVNASDVNEQTENCLYAEGSLICRLLMGTVGLRKVRQNRVLLVTEDRRDAPNVVDQTINCAEGARATLGHGHQRSDGAGEGAVPADRRRRIRAA